MKEKMNKNNIEALIDYRYQRSDEAIQEAEKKMKAEHK